MAKKKSRRNHHAKKRKNFNYNKSTNKNVKKQQPISKDNSNTEEISKISLDEKQNVDLENQNFKDNEKEQYEQIDKNIKNNIALDENDEDEDISLRIYSLPEIVTPLESEEEHKAEAKENGGDMAKEGKNNNKLELWRKIITLASCIIVVICLVSMVSAILFDFSKEKDSIKIENPADEFAQACLAKKNSFPEGIREEFKKVYLTNDDAVGVLSFEGIDVEQPIVQTKDNKYYKAHDFFKNKSKKGNAFVDSKCKIKPLGKNTVIYVNNTKDNDCEFSSIINYEKKETFNRSPVLSFNTMYKSLNWKIYGCFYTTVSRHDDNGYVFDYACQDLNKNNFNGFIKEIDRRAIYKTSVDINSDDKLLIISMPVFNDYFGKSKKVVKTRFVLVARLLRQNESKVVVTSKTRYNRKVYKPQVYFDNTSTRNYFKNVKKWTP